MSSQPNIINPTGRLRVEAGASARNAEGLAGIRSLESTVQGFEERTTRLESDIKDSQKRAGEFETKVGSPFEKEERYHHLARLQSEIEEQLDLTKNQAPNQLEAVENSEAIVQVEPPGNAETINHKPTPRMKV